MSSIHFLEGTQSDLNTSATVGLKKIKADHNDSSVLYQVPSQASINMGNQSDIVNIKIMRKEITDRKRRKFHVYRRYDANNDDLTER